jgi:hypothetical protein
VWLVKLVGSVGSIGLEMSFIRKDSKVLPSKSWLRAVLTTFTRAIMRGAQGASWDSA